MDITEIIFPINIIDLAKLLGKDPGAINSRLSENRDKFKKGVDYIPGKRGKRSPKYPRPDDLTKFSKEGSCIMAGFFRNEESRDFRNTYCSEYDSYINQEIKDQYFYLNIIKYAIKGFIDDNEIKEEYRVEDEGNYYRIDLYLPELRIAIECDEPHHKNKDEIDLKRQVKIEKLMNCKFIHFNPREKDINKKIGDIINKLFAIIQGIDKEDIHPRLEKYKRWSEKDIEAEKEKAELEEKERISLL